MVSPWRCVVSYHTNPMMCGVAKFNTQLAAMLSVPLVPTRRRSLPDGPALLSLKAEEWGIRRPDHLPDLFDVIWHGAPDPEISDRARHVWFAETIGCPVVPLQPVRRGRGVRLFTFGMAHKLEVRYVDELVRLFRKGHGWLPTTSWRISAALHEGDVPNERFAATLATLARTWPGSMTFLGYLSDAAVAEELAVADACLLFFESGVRANNTSAQTAMAAGALVITNLTAQSPPGFVHGRTVYDIAHLKTWPQSAARRRVARAGQRLIRDVYNWETWLTTFTLAAKKRPRQTKGP